MQFFIHGNIKSSTHKVNQFLNMLLKALRFVLFKEKFIFYKANSRKNVDFKEMPCNIENLANVIFLQFIQTG